jgi:hypothetical protein
MQCSANYRVVCCVENVRAETLSQSFCAQGTPPPMLVEVATSLCALPTTRKGRYTLLATLVPFTGASALLQRHPLLIQESLRAMHEDTAAAASDLFRALLTVLHSEVANPSNVSVSRFMDPNKLQNTWLPHVVAALLDPKASTRNRVAAYSLPAILKLDPDNMRLLLQALYTAAPVHVTAPSREQHTPKPLHLASGAAAAVLVLRAGKQAAVFHSLDDIENFVGSATGAGLCDGISEQLLDAAACSLDESLRMDVLELATLHPKATAVRSWFFLLIF